MHEPVLVAEVVELMAGARIVVDMTLGGGGHAEALLEAGVGRVVGVDRDPDAISHARDRLAAFGDRFTPVQARFSEVPRIAAEASFRAVEGTIYDLGVSSLHLDRPDRGFTYRDDGPLDMRMGPEGPTAADLVADLPEAELADLIFRYGEERLSRRISRAIVRAREREPIVRTAQLAAIVAGAVPRRRGSGHPARRTFQALRIAVNNELSALDALLRALPRCLAPGGRAVILTFHSGEDRRVKKAFQAGLRDGTYAAVARDVIRSSMEETRANRRSSAAKLRWAVRAERTG